MARNLSAQERDRIFGPLRVVSTSGRDAVQFEQPPPLERVYFGTRTATVHTLAAPSLSAIARELAADGLIERIKSITGYQPRLVRNADGSNSQNLSAHAYGAAVDVNHDANPQGTLGTAEQAELAPYFERHGWFWGRNFAEPDPHHFAFQGVDPLASQDVQPPSSEDGEEDFSTQPRPGLAQNVASSGGLLVPLALLGVGLALTMKKRR